MSRTARVTDDRARVLVAGGGVAALETMLALRTLAPELVQTELLAPEPHFWYRPLAVAEPFGAGSAHHFELAAITRGAGAVLTLGALAAVEVERKVVLTTSGAELPYDVLVLACGAVPKPDLDEALTFRGPADTEKIATLVDELARGAVRSVAFAVRSAGHWPLPLYELALMTASHLRAGGRDAKVTFVTHEERPLGLFGKAASERLATLLQERGIALLSGRHSLSYDGSELSLAPGPGLRAERVVTLPKLEGPPIEGIPAGRDGFVPVDDFGRVRDLPCVFAAGDITDFPVKQGGIAAQAADVVAEAIAAGAGAALQPKPFRPVLRGLLLTGGAPAFMRAELTEGVASTEALSSEPLWWPAGKIVGRYLAPVLARFLGYAEAAPPSDGIPVEVDLASVHPTAA